MTDSEREDWLGARKILIRELDRTARLLIDYPSDGDDEEYRFLARKAAKLRDWIAEIDQRLNAEDDKFSP